MLGKDDLPLRNADFWVSPFLKGSMMCRKCGLTPVSSLSASLVCAICKGHKVGELKSPTRFAVRFKMVFDDNGEVIIIAKPNKDGYFEKVYDNT